MLSEFNFYDSKEQKDKIGYLISGRVVADSEIKDYDKKDGTGKFRVVRFGVSNFAEIVNIKAMGFCANPASKIKKGDFVIVVCRDLERSDFNNKEYLNYIADTIMTNPYVASGGYSKPAPTDKGSLIPVDDSNLPF